MAEQKSSSALTAPLHGAASVLRRVPGAGMVSRAAEGTLDKVGAVSPRGRRIAVYAGAGVLGAAGVVEWPVALTGAAVAWLTQPRPAHPAAGESGAGQEPEPAHDLGSAALRSGHGTAPGNAGGTGAAASVGGGSEAAGTTGAASGAGTAAAGGAGASAGDAASASGGGRSHGGRGSSGSARASRGAEGSAVKPPSGPLGPTARPDRTTL
ncbi:hypothetical protein [Streptomyces sp. NPDC007205]|uniref:hypothetical protein n=1 Tax=Streptomyces sp. NPDC007205 TaxID=3154316 RepID=UPI0033FB6780